jgi:excisionase family DNA binding protein
MERLAADSFVSIAEAAETLHVHASTIRRWIDVGTLPAYRVGGRRVLVKREDLAKVVAPLASRTSRGPRLTPEQQRQFEEAIAASRRLLAEQLDARGGVPYPPSWELINQERDRRSEELG